MSTHIAEEEFARCHASLFVHFESLGWVKRICRSGSSFSLIDFNIRAFCGSWRHFGELACGHGGNGAQGKGMQPLLFLVLGARHLAD